MRAIFIVSVAMCILLIGVFVYAQFGDEQSSEIQPLHAVNDQIIAQSGDITAQTAGVDDAQIVKTLESEEVPVEAVVPVDELIVDEGKYSPQQMEFLNYLYGKLSDDQKEELREAQTISFEQLIERKMKEFTDAK